MLLTHEIEVQLQEQFIKVWSGEADYFDMQVICKVVDSEEGYEYYLITQDPEDPYYLWAILTGDGLEVSSVYLPILKASHIYLDLSFKPMKAGDLYKSLQKGDDV